MNTPIKQGWQCPCCETVYAPHVSSCKCKKVEAIKPQPSKIDNDPAITDEMKERWRRMMEEQIKNKEPLPIPQWPNYPTIPSPPPLWWETPYHLKPFEITCVIPLVHEGSVMMR